MTRVSEIAEHWFGLCKKPPTIRTASALIVIEPETVHPASSDGSGSSGSSGRIRQGISIAAGSLRALIHDRQLLWFTFLAGLVMLFLIAAEGWMGTHLESALPFLIGIPIGGAFWVLDIRLFLLEMVCLSCCTLVLAGLVLHRNGNTGKTTETVRESFTRINGHAGSLLGLSLVLALVGTLVYMIVSQSQFFGKIVSSISMVVFYLPYAYYLPNELSGALYFAFEIMFINAILLLIVLYSVPVIVIGKKGLLHSLAGSLSLIKKTWREMLGCLFVLGAIFLGVSAIALVIGQSPQLLNHDYDFFLSLSRGRLLMTIVCYGFILSCWILMAVGFTTAGIAIADLYRIGKSYGISGIPEGNLKKPEPVV
jgi:hypothetical protein